MNTNTSPENVKPLGISHTSMNAQEEGNNSQSGKIVEIIDLPETPFHLVKTEVGYFLAIGNKRVTELTEDEEKLRNDVVMQKYNLLVSLITVICEGVYEELQKQNLSLKSKEQ